MDGLSLQILWNTMASGGPVMFVLALLSLVLYSNVIGLLLFVKRVDFQQIGRAESYSRIQDTELRMGAGIDPAIRSYEDSLMKFRHFIKSRMKYIHALLVAAPLLGLLGTVVGMLDTFRGLSLQAGFETMRLVAEGVHRALITTQTGLVIAIPALFLIYWVRRVSKKRELELLQVKILAFSNHGEE